MLITATQKYVRTSPRKLRYVADSVRALKKPTLILSHLEVIEKDAAKILAKVFKTVIANATNNLKLEPDTLFLKEIQIGEGPTYKRGQPVSRGRFHRIEKKTSHITITLESLEKAKPVEKPKRKDNNGTKS